MVAGLHAAARGVTSATSGRFHFVGHQANLRMLETTCERGGHRAGAPPLATSSGTATPARRARARVMSMNWEKWTRGRRRRASSASAPASPGRATSCASTRSARVKYAEFRARDHFDARRAAGVRARAGSSTTRPSGFDVAPPAAADADDRPHHARSSAAARAGAIVARARRADRRLVLPVPLPRTIRCSRAASASTACGSCVGFYCNWAGGLGSGRALGCGEVEFFGQIRPHDELRAHEIDVRRYTELEKAAGSSIAIGDADALRRRRADLHDQAREVRRLPRHRLRRVPVAGQEREGREARAVSPGRSQRWRRDERTKGRARDGRREGHRRGVLPRARRRRASASPCTTGAAPGSARGARREAARRASRCARISRCPRRSTRSSPSSRTRRAAATCSSTTRAST